MLGFCTKACHKIKIERVNYKNQQALRLNTSVAYLNLFKLKSIDKGGIQMADRRLDKMMDSTWHNTEIQSKETLLTIAQGASVGTIPAQSQISCCQIGTWAKENQMSSYLTIIALWKWWEIRHSLACKQAFRMGYYEISFRIAWGRARERVSLSR